MRTVARSLCLIVACSFFLAGTSAAARKSPAPLKQEPHLHAEDVLRLEVALERHKSEETVRRGAKVFARFCSVCHGRHGRGDGPAAAELDPAPRDLTARQFRFRTTGSGESPRPEDLERSIRRGLPGSAMPAFWELFSTEEIDDLVAFVYSLRPGEEAPPEPLRVPAVAQPGPSTLDEGKTIYLVSGCWRCHGVKGAGRGPSAKGLTDENEQPIRTTDFRYDPFKGGRELEAIVRTLLTGLNGAPMPSYGDAMLFAREDAEDLSALSDVLTDEARAELTESLRLTPSRAGLDELGDADRLELRDRRLAALAHYVLSFSRRKGFFHKLFRDEPEKEGRE